MQLKLPLQTRILMTLCLTCTASVAGATADDDKCEKLRSRAAGRFVQCMTKRADTHHYATCVRRMVDDEADIPDLAGTICEGPRFVDNLDGTVTDTLTGLRWEMKTNPDNTVNPADPHDADNVYTLTDDTGDPTDDDGTAYTDFLASLNAGAGFAGSKSWRLPTLVELYTLYAVGNCTESCTDPVLGPVGTANDSLYWSTTSHPGYSLYGRLADENPDASTSAPRAAGYHVRAVREGFIPF